jgi:hypothetical protein
MHLQALSRGRDEMKERQVKNDGTNELHFNYFSPSLFIIASPLILSSSLPFYSQSIMLT